MNDRAAQRIERLRILMDEREIPAFLVSSDVNVSYLSGFTGDSTPLIVLPDRVVAISDERYRVQLETECPDLDVYVRPVSQLLWDAVAETAKKVRVSLLAFEANVMSVSTHQKLADQISGVALAGFVGLVEELRSIKDDEEIGLIREAVSCAERAFRSWRGDLVLSHSEVDSANSLEEAMRWEGSSSPAFDTIIAAGRSSALPHARPGTETTLDESPFVLVDWGATVRGYRSDLTRIIFTGTVAREYREMYEAVLAAQRRAIAAIRPGRLAGEIDAEARRAIEESSFGSLFGHGTGHGLGREIHESPWIRPHSEDVLAPGMVFTVEPGVYRPGLGGVRIEDDVLVTPDGVEILSSLEKDFDAVQISH